MTALATDSGRKMPARLAGSAILALQSDERLVKLVRAGHERAFDAIVERYRKPLVRYCHRILPDSRCEDAVQQALLNAHTALAASDEPLQLKPWLFAITRNAALNILRQNGWNYDEIPADFDGVRRPDQIFDERVQLEQTVAALSDLPERQRDAMVMREFEGRSYDEIALALGTGEGAVRQLLNRARVTLRSAASALVPPPLVERAAALPPSDGGRLAEIIGGLGAAGVAKAGATAVVAGTLVVGAVKAPLPLGDRHKTTREKATLSVDHAATAAGRSGTDRPAAAVLTQPAGTSNQGTTNHRGSPVVEPREDRSGHSGSGDDSRERSGSDDGTRSRSGPGDGSGTRTDDHSGPGSGSDDSVATTVLTTDGSGTSGTSGSSGSGTSGSDGSLSSGSGTSGSDDSLTSGTSGSDDSLTSGSGTSGSGSSGSDDVVPTRD